ncbi:putative DD41D transposase [Trichonephila clavipes]|nr:putative DD41D transposase [Trichonephila clavipes]
MDDFTYAENVQTHITCMVVQMVTAEQRYECITRCFLIEECWITEFFSEYIVNLVKYVHSTSPGMRLNGYVNKQNCRIWSEANPQVYVETPLHPEKLTVWCALWVAGIIGPYFFKNDEGHNVTVNGDRYRAMITNFLIPELNNHDVQELWFQQDGATCHTIDLLRHVW